MTDYISAEAQEILENPTPGKVVPLLLGVNGDNNTAEEQVRIVSEGDCEKLGHSTLRVVVPETDVESIEQLDTIKSVEVEGKIEFL